MNKRELVFSIIELRDIIDNLCFIFGQKDNLTQKDISDLIVKSRSDIEKYYVGEFANEVLEQILGTHPQTHKL